jgi:DNA-binding protein HU-beta
MRIVSKFGGSSMADAMAMKRSAQVAYQKQSSIVVVSATYGTTNQLIQLSQLAVQGNQAQVDLTLKEIVKTASLITQKRISIGDTIDMIGFGSFSISNRSARTGRNPQTGKEIKIAAKSVVKFKAGAELSKSVN